MSMKVIYWDEKAGQQKEREATPGEVQAMEAARAKQNNQPAPSGK